MFCTNLVFVLGALVLHKQLQTFFPDERLGSAASTMALLWLISVGVVVLILGLVRLADHFPLAEIPHDLHPSFGIADVPDFICKSRVRLTTGNSHVRLNEARCEEHRR